ncbi:MAG: site-2 protease family protein [Armatimonadia bacterium]
MLLHLLSGPVNWGDVLAWLLAVVVAITVHEFAHAKSAEIAGDPTARKAGRVTLNPLAHYDLVGSSMFLIMGFGWAKPVPINPLYFKNRRRDSVLVSLWGPLANLIAAIVLAIPLRVGFAGDHETTLAIMVFANLMLAVFNLIPIAPLDGSHILEGALSARANQRLAAFYARNQQLLLIAFLVGFLTPVGGPVFRMVQIPVYIMVQLLTGHGLFYWLAE